MLLPKSVRKIIGVFRGSVSPTAVFLSAGLGFWFGLMPGWYGLHVLLLVIALIFAIHAGTFILFAGFGKALCYAAAPVWFHLGRWVQESLGGLLDALGGVPIIGLTDFSRSALAGTLVAGPTIGVVGGLLLARGVFAFRKAWLTLDEGSEAFRKFQSNTLVRWLDWLLLGKRAKDVREALKKKTSVVRIPGVIVAVVVMAASAIGLQFVQGDALGGAVAEQLTARNGAEVNLASFALSPLAGRVKLDGLQVTDPANLDRNRIAVGSLTADVSVWSLLCGRIVVDEVAVADVQLDAPRETPGVLVMKDEEAVAQAEDEAFEPQQYTLPSDDVSRLVDFYKNAGAVREKLEYAVSWLPEGEPPPPPPPEPEGYLEYLTARIMQSPTPRVVVRRAKLEGVRLPVEAFGASVIECENLSDAPLAAGESVVIDVASQSRPTKLRMVYHYETLPVVVEIAGSIGDVDLKKLQASLNPQNPVKFEAGTAMAEIRGTASRTALDLSLKVATQGLRATTAGQGFFGMKPEVANEAFKVLENITTTLRIVGPPSDPRLAFDSPGIRKEFEQALVAAGKRELAGRLNEALGDKVPAGVDAGEALDDPLKAGKGALEGFLGGKKKKEEGGG